MSVEKYPVEEVLAGRVLLYRLFQSITGAEPSKGNLEVLFGPAVEVAFELCIPGKADELRAALAPFSDSLDAEADDLLDRLKDEYTRLYLGPNKLVAPPWESSYLGGDRQIFQESTLAVRKAYVSCGFLPTEYRKVADDHIAIELGFLAELGRQMLEAHEAGEGSRLRELAKTSADFLGNHPGKWIPSYLRDIQTAQGSGFYPTVAALLNAFVREDIAFLTTAVN